MTDVEYAKREDNIKPHDGVRTVRRETLPRSCFHLIETIFKGTLFFMALEVESRCYIYSDLAAIVEDDEDPDDEDLDCQAAWELSRAARNAKLLARQNATGDAKSPIPKQSAAAVAHTKIAAVPFKHNPLHDLESIAWVVLWLFVCSKFVRTDSDMPKDVWDETLENHARLATSLFRDETFRRNAMTTRTTLLDGFATALPQLLKPIQDFDKLRIALVKQFTAVDRQRARTGRQVSFEDMINGKIHHTMINFLEKTADFLIDNDLKIDVSAWADQRNKMRNAVPEDNAEASSPTGTRRPADGMQDGAATSSKRHKQYEGQSATSAQALSLPVPMLSRDRLPRRSRRRRY